jgi:hypothetical protein
MQTRAWKLGPVEILNPENGTRIMLRAVWRIYFPTRLYLELRNFAVKIIRWEESFRIHHVAGIMTQIRESVGGNREQHMPDVQKLTKCTFSVGQGILSERHRFTLQILCFLVEDDHLESERADPKAGKCDLIFPWKVSTSPLFKSLIFDHQERSKSSLQNDFCAFTSLCTQTGPVQNESKVSQV